MASAVLAAWREQQGDVLAFLPGVGEIERTRERLAEKLPNVPILPLHGQVEPQGQRAAIKRDPDGRRRIVLATGIAETSLTLDGVSVVVDSGLARRAEFDLAAGVSHLVTTRASRAAAAQRAGRAARQGAGVAYRLWEEAAHPGRPEFDPPEMLDLGSRPAGARARAMGPGRPGGDGMARSAACCFARGGTGRLKALGALDGEGRITEFGRKLAQLPMEPPLAAMVLFGAEAGDAREAARLALLLQERGLGGRSEDLSQRLSRWSGDRSARAEASRKLAEGWAARAEKLAEGKREGAPIPPSSLLAHFPTTRTPSRCFGRKLDQRGRAGLFARSGLSTGPRRMARDRRCAGQGAGGADQPPRCR